MFISMNSISQMVELFEVALSLMQMQGDTSGCGKPPFDSQAIVPFWNFCCCDVNGRFATNWCVTLLYANDFIPSNRCLCYLPVSARHSCCIGQGLWISLCQAKLCNVILPWSPLIELVILYLADSGRLTREKFPQRAPVEQPPKLNPVEQGKGPAPGVPTNSTPEPPADSFTSMGAWNQVQNRIYTGWHWWSNRS